MQTLVEMQPPRKPPKVATNMEWLDPISEIGDQIAALLPAKAEMLREYLEKRYCQPSANPVQR